MASSTFIAKRTQALPQVEPDWRYCNKKNVQYLIIDNNQITSEDSKILDNLSKTIFKDFLKEFEKLTIINKDNLEKIIKNLIEKNKTNFKSVGQPLRIALVGSKFGPGIYDIILSLDKNEVIHRLKAIS